MSKNQQQKQNNSGFIDPLGIQNYDQCKYCGTHFLPKKRFVQKYCSESCRVMACRARKAGINEIPLASLGQKPQPTHRRSASSNPKQTPEQKNTTLLAELKSYLDNRDARLLKKVEKIREQQNYHMWISALAPLLAEPVRKGLGRLFQGNKTPEDVNQFLAQVTPTIKELQEELQVRVLNSAKEYWDVNEKGNDVEKNKQTSLPDLNQIL